MSDKNLRAEIPKSLARSAAWSLLVVLLFAPVAAARRESRDDRPNVLCILVDDLGYGDLSSYGAKGIRTPNIDSLIAAGTRFDNFYANSPVCSPSRAALLTGRYPDFVGVPGVIRTDPRDSWGYLAPAATMLPASLERAGYDTALIGKWHLGLDAPNLPNNRGFRFFRGFLGDMMDDYYTHLRHNINYMREDTRTIKPIGHATDLFTRWTIEYLNERKRVPRQPFFLYLAYTAPHVPLQAPREWIERIERREPGMNPQRQKLAALIEHLDENIGRVVAALKANDQYDNTIIVFTSDNGGALDAGASNGALRGGKEELYEGGIRVPFGVVWGKRIRPGARSSRVTMMMDLMPTFCEAAGVNVKDRVEGKSFLSSLTRDEASSILEDRTFFWMRREGGSFYHGKDYYAVRRGRWKLVQNHPYMPFRLYDLAADPSERMDVSKENRATYEALSESLRDHLRRAGAVPWQKSE